MLETTVTFIISATVGWIGHYFYDHVKSTRDARLAVYGKILDGLINSERYAGYMVFAYINRGSPWDNNEWGDSTNQAMVDCFNQARDCYTQNVLVISDKFAAIYTPIIDEAWDMDDADPSGYAHFDHFWRTLREVIPKLKMVARTDTQVWRLPKLPRIKSLVARSRFWA